MAKAKHAPRNTDEPRAWPVVGQHLDTLNAITDGLALVHTILGPDVDPGIPLDILAGENPATRDLVSPIRFLAESLVEDAANARADGLKAPGRSAAIEAINTAIAEAHFRTSRRTRKDVLGDAGQLVHEIGLEFHDLQCTLTTAPDGHHVILVHPVPSPQAQAWLIEHLFQRVEAFVGADENLALERAASAWFFDCWSDGGEDDALSHSEFPRMMREQEWSLVSRDTLSLDEPAIASFTVEQDPPDVPPRQQRLATAYAQSTVGIFEIITVDGRYITVRDTITGQTHRYHEHSEEANPYPGLLILGRMIPLEDDLWLRSPGAVIIVSPDDGLRDHLSTALTSLLEGLPTPIALEAVISLAAYGAQVPVARLPAPTIASAHATLAAVDDMLEAIGVYDIDDAEIPPDDFARRNAAEQEQFEQRVDQALGDWIAALTEQIELETPRREAQAAKRKKRVKQQHTRRRKR